MVVADAGDIEPTACTTPDLQRMMESYPQIRAVFRHRPVDGGADPARERAVANGTFGAARSLLSPQLQPQHQAQPQSGPLSAPLVDESLPSARGSGRRACAHPAGAIATAVVDSARGDQGRGERSQRRAPRADHSPGRDMTARGDDSLDDRFSSFAIVFQGRCNV